MSNWKTYKLGEITEIIGGGTPSTSNGEYWDGDIPWLTPRDLTGYTNRFISKGERSITEKGLKNSSAKLLPQDTILLTSRAPIGYLAIAESEICTNQGFKNFIVDKSKVHNEFLYYLLKNNVDNIRSVGTGTTFAEVSASTLKNIEFQFPETIAEQKAIAAILSSLDSKIELNLQMNQTLETMAQAIFKEWFVKFNFPGFDGELVDGLPKGWRKGKVGDCVIIKRGGSPRPIQDFISDKGLRWLKISDVTDLKTPFVLETKEFIKEEGLSKTTLLKSGALVLSNSATPGIPKILNVDTCIHDGWLHFPQSKLSNEFLYLKFLELRMKLVQMANGSIFTNLKTEIVREFEIDIPDVTTLMLFDGIIKPIFEKLLENTIQIKSISELRDSLLPKLMCGKIEIL